MCIICEIKQQGESIHRAMEELLEQKELEQSAIKAQVNLDNADAVNKLVRAAEALRETGEHAYANRVLLALDAILPKREERRTGEVNTAAAESITVPAEEPKKAEPVIDEFEGAPPQLKAYVEMMRKAGVKVEVVRLPL